MKIQLHIPTETFGFIGVEYETSGDISYAEAAREYKLFADAFNVGEGLPDKDFDEFIQNIIEEKPSHIETLEKLSEEQRKFMKVVDRAMNRINYKLRKETQSQDDHIKSIN